MGLAVGDAVGASTEFLEKDEIIKIYGIVDDMLGGGWLNLKPGETTDDTAMMIAVAKGILKSPHDPIKSIGENFLAWESTKPKDIGVTILYTFKYVKEETNGDWLKAAHIAHLVLKKSAGNGSLMRCLPIALFYKDEDEMIDKTIKQSRMTHYDNLAAEACVIYNKIAFDILNNGTDMKESIIKHVTKTRYEMFINEDPSANPDGYVVNTFSWVIRTLMRTSSYRSAVLSLTNLGHDADTTSAIAGGLAGLHYGYQSIPSEWVDLIDKRTVISALATIMNENRT